MPCWCFSFWWFLLFPQGGNNYTMCSSQYTSIPSRDNCYIQAQYSLLVCVQLSVYLLTSATSLIRLVGLVQRESKPLLDRIQAFLFLQQKKKKRKRLWSVANQVWGARPSNSNITTGWQFGNYIYTLLTTNNSLEKLYGVAKMNPSQSPFFDVGFMNAKKHF